MRRIYDKDGEVDPSDPRLIDLEWENDGEDMSWDELQEKLREGYMVMEPDWDKKTDDLLKLRAEFEALPD